MKVMRGDIVLARYPFASGKGGKVRPCLVVQHDRDNARMLNTIVVQITTNLRSASEPTSMLIHAGTSEFAQSGLLHTRVISCSNLQTIEDTLIQRRIGSLPIGLVPRLEVCLKAALDIT